MNIIQRPSPNHDARPANAKIEAIVLHGTAGSSAEGDLSHTAKPSTKAAYHYIVGRDGTKYQSVQEDRRAWHAGKSIWQGRMDLNSWSISVGLTNRGPVDKDARNAGVEEYTTDQIMSAAELIVDICDRRKIPWRMILTHAQVSPGRKTDPWLHFPWGEMAGAMLSYQTIRGAA